MKLLRIILFPAVPIYYLVTSVRNWLYNKGIKSSKSYDVPIICVGNLSTGGTGKSPMIEYLIRLLKGDYSIATLSRGYKRITEGFVLADEEATADTIGDEPYQFFKKFEDIKVAVDGNRKNGIQQLMNSKQEPEVILLDDAFQHRKVKAGFNILLTAYYNLYSSDIVLPTGNLREPRSGAKRADVIVVTKCPVDLTDSEKSEITSKLKVNSTQKLFFSHISYSEVIISKKNSLKLNEIGKFTLVTGIANSTPLVEFLNNKGMVFDHIEYPDHYSFRQKDIEILSSKEFILTTEKDFVRLSDNEDLQSILYYLPIHLEIDKNREFDLMIQDFIN